MDGSIGVVSYYDRLLSTEEIEQMWASKGASFLRHGCLFLWTMSGNGKSTGETHPIGTRIKDSIGSRDGQTSAPWSSENIAFVLVSSVTRSKRGRR